MKEQDIQKKIVKHLEKQGAYTVKVISASKAGVPDVLVCYKGVFIGVEVKTPKTIKNVSKLQAFNITKIQEAGGIAGIASCIEEADALLKLVDNL
jgi:Holliday junction resolvase